MFLWKLVLLYISTVSTASIYFNYVENIANVFENTTQLINKKIKDALKLSIESHPLASEHYSDEYEPVDQDTLQYNVISIENNAESYLNEQDCHQEKMFEKVLGKLYGTEKLISSKAENSTTIPEIGKRKVVKKIMNNCTKMVEPPYYNRTEILSEQRSREFINISFFINDYDDDDSPKQIDIFLEKPNEP
uniref:Spaetzle domain-containing protein n=1 Tax=Clastoptera arizonana TaxID=38151 RepID=A0A1B6CRI7_9HEMI